MTLVLTRSPADIIVQYLVSEGLASLPTDNVAEWPAYCSAFGTDGDEAICVYDTAGTKDFRLMGTGETKEKHGFQIRVRARTHSIGYTKAAELCRAMDAVRRAQMDFEDMELMLHSVSRKSSIIPLGEVEEKNRRTHFTINFVLTLSAKPRVVDYLEIDIGNGSELFHLWNGNLLELV